MEVLILTPANEALVELRAVRKVFDGRAAVDGVSMRIERGEVLGLLGPNGAGKTTTIRMIVGILAPDEGELRVGAGSIGYLPEERGLYPSLRVEEVLVYLGRLHGLDRWQARRRAEAHLDRVGLLDARRRRMRELSRGMQQKVQIIAALLHEPQLLVLDEPFSGLDPVHRGTVAELIGEVVGRGAGVLFSSHEMTPVERLCRRVVLIDRGRVAIEGEVDELRSRFADGRTIRLETDAALEADGEVVAQVEGSRVRLREGVTPEEFLARLVARGHRVRGFETVRPTLEEIFVRVVRGR